MLIKYSSFNYILPSSDNFIIFYLYFNYSLKNCSIAYYLKFKIKGINLYDCNFKIYFKII